MKARKLYDEVEVDNELLYEIAKSCLKEKDLGFDQKNSAGGSTIFLTTHHIEEAEFLAQRVAFLDEGRIVSLDSSSRLIERVGAWAIDELSDDGIRTHYFKTRDGTNSFKASGSFTLRRVNLEDAFLHLTGRKVTGEALPISGGHWHH